MKKGFAIFLVVLAVLLVGTYVAVEFFPEQVEYVYPEGD